LNNVARYGAIVPRNRKLLMTLENSSSKEQLNRLLRLQKRCARMILDGNFQDNSVMLFSKLGWLPIDDIIKARNLSLLHKICNGWSPK